MTNKDLYHEFGNIDPEMVEAAAPSQKMKNKKRNTWTKWVSIAACFCLMITAIAIIIPYIAYVDNVNNAGDGNIAMLFTEAKVIEVYSTSSVLVEITNENIYGANTDKNLFEVGEIVRADFNEEIVLNFKPGDIVIIGRGNTAKVDYSQKPYIAQCNSIKLKVSDNSND